MSARDMADWTYNELFTMQTNYHRAAIDGLVFTEREFAEYAAINTEIARRMTPEDMARRDAQFCDEHDLLTSDLDSDPYDGDADERGPR